MTELNTSMRERIARGQAAEGGRFNPGSLLEASQLHHYYHTGERVEVDVYGDGECIERGRIGTTTGWMPAFLLIHRRNDIGSSTLLDKRAKVLKVVANA
jgi:hypothetical protein